MMGEPFLTTTRNMEGIFSKTNLDGIDTTTLARTGILIKGRNMEEKDGLEVGGRRQVVVGDDAGTLSSSSSSSSSSLSSLSSSSSLLSSSLSYASSNWEMALFSYRAKRKGRKGIKRGGEVLKDKGHRKEGTEGDNGRMKVLMEERWKEMDRKEKGRKETERKETESKETEKIEMEKKETERKETERKETKRKETERKEKEGKETERKETERKETERKETVRKELERKELERKEMERKEMERKEMERKKKEVLESLERDKTYGRPNVMLKDMSSDELGDVIMEGANRIFEIWEKSENLQGRPNEGILGCAGKIMNAFLHFEGRFIVARDSHLDTVNQLRKAEREIVCLKGRMERMTSGSPFFPIATDSAQNTRVDRNETERKRKEMERKEKERKEMKRKKMERKEMERKEMERKETERKEMLEGSNVTPISPFLIGEVFPLPPLLQRVSCNFIARSGGDWMPPVVQSPPPIVNRGFVGAETDGEACKGGRLEDGAMSGSELDWKLVGGRRRRKSPSTTWRQTKGRPLRPPLSSAVAINGRSEGFSYAAALKSARENIDLETLGINETRVRKAANGGFLIEVLGENSRTKAEKLGIRIRDVLQDSAAVSCPTKKSELHITGFDESVSVEEIARVISSCGGCNMADVKTGSIRTLGSGLRMVWVQLPMKAAIKLVDIERVRLGWTMARVELIKTRPLQCYRCWRYGHTQSMCHSVVDRRNACFKCGQSGHLASACQNRAFCAVCHDAGMEATHRLGGPLCVKQMGKQRSTSPSTKGSV